MLFAKKYRTIWIVLAVVLILGILMWLFVLPQKTTTLIQEPLTTATQPPNSVGGYKYSGCWNARNPKGTTTSAVALPYKLNMSVGDQTIDACVSIGERGGYQTVGLMYNSNTQQNECWAGNHDTTYLANDYTAYGPVTETDPDNPLCNINQPGNNTLMVYSKLNAPVTTPIDGYRYGGCWTDLSGSSYFSTQLGPTDANTNLSLTDCIGYGKTGGFDTVAYKAGGICYGGNQGTDGLNYKKGEELPNNNSRCDVGGPGPNTNIIYTTYGKEYDTPIKGYDYLGCYNDPNMPLGLIGTGHTLDTCIAAAKSGGKFAGEGKRVGRYDTVYFTEQNVCKGATLGAGSTLKNQVTDSPGCNAYYPQGELGIVYSTSTVTDNDDHTNPSFDGDLLEKIQKKIGISGHQPTRQIGDYQFRGYWVESKSDPSVKHFLGALGLEQCLAKAKNDGYTTVSFQNTNQCWAGTDANYKKYGKPTDKTLSDPNSTVAAIYSIGPEPSRHVSCGAHREGVEAMGDVPQPSYSIPQTTTVVFDPVPKTNTIITYSQTPIQPIETSTGAAASASSSTGAATDNSPVSQLNNANLSKMNQKDKSSLHRSWLPNTPFVYENNNMDSADGSSSSSSPAMNGSGFPKTDLINNQYPSSSNNNAGLEFFTTVAKISDKDTKKMKRENIESMSPPPESVPGPFVPKTMVVPPVCPSIPPVIIKTDCSACNKAAAAAAENAKKNQSANMNNQMSNTFANANSPNGGNPYATSMPSSQGPSCNNNNSRTYDNIPQPYLPSFSGFGM